MPASTRGRATSTAVSAVVWRTFTVNEDWTAAPWLSVASTVKVLLAPVTTPLSAPDVAFKVSPDGRVPEETRHRYGGCPPSTGIRAKKASPRIAAGSGLPPANIGA